MTLAPLQRAQLLGQRGSVNVMLGRLDQASRGLGQANSLVSQLVSQLVAATDGDLREALDAEFVVLLVEDRGHVDTTLQTHDVAL